MYLTNGSAADYEKSRLEEGRDLNRLGVINFRVTSAFIAGGWRPGVRAICSASAESVFCGPSYVWCSNCVFCEFSSGIFVQGDIKPR